MIIADSDGVGLKMLQFTTSTPTSFGRIRVFLKSSSSAPNITIEASALPSFMVEMFSETNKSGSTDLQIVGGFETGEINEIDRSRARHEINGESEDENSKKSKNSSQSFRHSSSRLRFPISALNTRTSTGTVAKLDKIRQPTANPDRESDGTGVRTRGFNTTVDDLRGEEVVFSGRGHGSLSDLCPLPDLIGVLFQIYLLHVILVQYISNLRPGPDLICVPPDLVCNLDLFYTSGSIFSFNES
ncbi:hypothetical protein Ccrd_026623 [Cynara cardunculus var. scolymus]|uniref:Uncharacterized protein n=1 Tax=Cynara cardunculus var. scolymus TaxID=59895 RepID=A0A103XD96_CYNCS|nr:hypothetical protein Ccrd_026623 [Cynara cardunculus var. scolymus]